VTAPLSFNWIVAAFALATSSAQTTIIHLPTHFFTIA
jgi:hypothetical protein